MTHDKKWLDFLAEVHADVEREEIQRKAAGILKSITAQSMNTGVKVEETPQTYGKPIKTEFDQFVVALSYNGNTVSMQFFKGAGLRKSKYPKGNSHYRVLPVAPTALEVMYSLLLDASSADYSFENFCGEFGYDEDSRKAEQIWRGCQEQARKLRELLGAEYSTNLVEAMQENFSEMGY